MYCHDAKNRPQRADAGRLAHLQNSKSVTAHIVGLSIGPRPGAPVLQSVNAELSGFTGIIGPSGSGKTTLLHAIGGFIQPDHGHIRFCGPNGGVVKPSVAIVTQNTLDIISTLPADVQVALPSLSRGVPYAEAIIGARSTLASVGIGVKEARRLPHRLSGGQRQRVAIARARMQQADIVLADEPTANLDDASARAVMELLKREAEAGRLVIVASHDRNLIIVYSDTLWRCEGGELKKEPKVKVVSGHALSRPTRERGNLGFRKPLAKSRLNKRNKQMNQSRMKANKRRQRNRRAGT